MYVCCILYYIFHIIGSECSSDIRSVRGVTALRRHGRRTLHCCLQKRYRQKMVNRRATRKLSCNYICFNDLTCNFKTPLLSSPFFSYFAFCLPLSLVFLLHYSHCIFFSQILSTHFISQFQLYFLFIALDIISFYLL